MKSPKRKTPVIRIIQKIRALKPKTVADLRTAGIRLRLLGEGLYRAGFKVINCDLVVKFPEKTGGRAHARSEMRRLSRLKKLGVLDRFLPEVLYFDRETGVIAMRYYPAFEDFEAQADALGHLAGVLIRRLTRVSCSDIHTENVRQGLKNAVIIDLGL